MHACVSAVLYLCVKVYGFACFYTCTHVEMTVYLLWHKMYGAYILLLAMYALIKILCASVCVSEIMKDAEWVEENEGKVIFHF